MRFHAPRAMAFTVTATALVGCSTSSPERGDAQRGCPSLLDGRGFEDHMLVKQEPVSGQPGRFYCVFVEEQYRDEKPTTQVPARQVLYKGVEDTYTEAPTSIPVTVDFAQAPAAN